MGGGPGGLKCFYKSIRIAFPTFLTNSTSSGDNHFFNLSTSNKLLYPMPMLTQVEGLLLHRTGLLQGRIERVH